MSGMANPSIPGQLREVVQAAREAGATGIWTNLLFLRPGTREHFLEHLAPDWPELLPHSRQLYRGRAYLGAEETKPIRRQVSALAREFGVADRRSTRLEPEREPEQLTLAV
jgi:DNA repair photolyase